jgi:pimeloyl-ACP methyl ester carboxylesterase
VGQTPDVVRHRLLDTAAMPNFTVRVADGAALAVWGDGEGPPFVMVHGSIADHTTFDPFIEVLRRDWTTFAIDRRGFGASPDTDGYALDREFDDVAEVVDAVAARVGGPVTLWGHSFGASCALGGASRTTNVSHVVLYEPSLGLAYPEGCIAKLQDLVDRGEYEAAIVRLFTDVLEMDDAEIAGFRSDPMWPVRIAAAPTVPRECRVEESFVYAPDQFAGVVAPTLFLTGSDSPPDLMKATDEAAGAVVGSRVHVIQGHGHFAHKTDPELVAALIQDFVR